MGSPSLQSTERNAPFLVAAARLPRVHRLGCSKRPGLRGPVLTGGTKTTQGRAGETAPRRGRPHRAADPSGTHGLGSPHSAPPPRHGHPGWCAVASPRSGPLQAPLASELTCRLQGGAAGLLRASPCPRARSTQLRRGGEAPGTWRGMGATRPLLGDHTQKTRLPVPS